MLSATCGHCCAQADTLQRWDGAACDAASSTPTELQRVYCRAHQRRCALYVVVALSFVFVVVKMLAALLLCCFPTGPILHGDKAIA